MNLERLEYFVAVAENLNFTRAADACHVAQTAVSRHIAALEEEIGCKLFFRSSRAVELTPAGKAFYEEIVPMLSHYRRGVERARNAYQGKASSLRLGIGQYEGGLAAELFKEFHSLFPDIVLSLSQYPYDRLPERVRDGSVDVAFLSPYTEGAEERTDFAMYPVSSSRTCVLLEKDSPLTDKMTGGKGERRYFRAEDFREMELFAIVEQEGVMSLEAIRTRLASMGAEPLRLTAADSLSTLFSMVRAGLGAALVPAFLESELPDGLALYPQRACPEREYWCISRRESENPAAELFCRGILTSQTVMNRIRKHYVRPETARTESV